MNNYEIAVSNFENTRAGKLMAAINEMEKDRQAGWNSFFKADYRVDELEETIVGLLDCLLEEALCRKGCRKSTRK